MLPLRKILEVAHKQLDNAGVEHALIGAFALAALGVQRATADVDFLIHGDDRSKAKAALIGIGFDVFHESPEVVQFRGIGQLDLLLANRPLSQEMLKRAGRTKLLGIKCLDAEDIIGLKIQAYVNNPKRTLQDQADIQRLIEENPQLDWQTIKHYADLFEQWTTITDLKTRAGR